MSVQTVVDLPEDVVSLLGSPQAAAVEARRALVLELLRDARISQGRAAELLGLTRGQVLDIMAERRIPSGPETAEDLQEELASLRRYFSESGADGGR
jgi:predicted HTH domain antitoxin